MAKDGKATRTSGVYLSEFPPSLRECRNQDRNNQLQNDDRTFYPKISTLKGRDRKPHSGGQTVSLTLADIRKIASNGLNPHLADLVTTPVRRPRPRPPLAELGRPLLSVGIDLRGFLPVSEANTGGRLGARLRRKAKVKETIDTHLERLACLLVQFRPPYRVTITRTTSRLMDSHDNLRNSYKTVVDTIAARLGVDDGDTERVTWEYRQDKAKPYGTSITIREVDRGAGGEEIEARRVDAGAGRRVGAGDRGRQAE